VFFETLEHRVEHPDRGLCLKCRKGGPQSGADLFQTIFGWKGEGERMAVVFRKRLETPSGEEGFKGKAARS
jgi:hypothetical protein